MKSLKLEPSEKELLRYVTDLAKIFGYESYHPWLSLHSARGWPDVALCKPPRLILAELKTNRGKLTEAQTKWGELLSACSGIEYYVWRPADLDSGAIAEVLTYGRLG